MTHPKIEDTPLYPRKVYVFCSSQDKRDARFWLVSPEGRAITRLCAACAEITLLGLLRIEDGWRKEPIYHDDPNFADMVKARS